MLTTQFFDTKKIIVINHTGCGMMSATGEALVEALRAKGIEAKEAQIDPALPELKLDAGADPVLIKGESSADAAR